MNIVFFFRKWIEGKSSRHCDFTSCNGKHVSLAEMKEDGLDNRYLRKENIPSYPKCVFSVSNVRHVTDKKGLQGIFADEGFRGKDSYLWWDLSVTVNDCVSAKTEFDDDQVFSDPNQMPFLKEFTTSPAFQGESLYGDYCFTFNFRDLLNIYSKNYCNRTAPILRVMDTRLYKQEIEYSILVHPKYMIHYRKYPRLPFKIKNRLCGYSKGQISWCCQSPSNNYKHCLEVDNEREVYARSLGHSEYFVWDHVSVAFHMKRHWVLPVDHTKLSESLNYLA